MADVWLCGVPELCFGADWLVAASGSAAQNVVDVDKYIASRFVGDQEELNNLEWDDFREVEYQALKEISDSPVGSGRVVVYAAGRAMTDEIFELFQTMNDSGVMTVHCSRLGMEATGARAALIERSKRYAEACGYEFCIAAGDIDMERIEAELLGFIRRIVFGHGSDMGLVGADMQLYHDINDDMRTRSDGERVIPSGEVSPATLVGGTFFVSLTCSDVRELIDTGKILQLAEGMSAMELRVDLLRSWDLDFVRDQCARLRRSCPLPVIYTVRTRSQGGAFPDDEDRYFELSRMAIRCGFQWVDMESHWSERSRLVFLKQVQNARGTRVIGSHHFKDSNGGTADELKAQFLHCAHDGHVDIVKVVVTASSLDDALQLVQVSRNLQLPAHAYRGSAEVGVIALAMGAPGITSRIMNQHFTPVSHPCMNTKAAPGQIPLTDILDCRRIINVHQVPKRYFYVIGTALNNTVLHKYIKTGFEYCHVDHTCEVCETDSISEVTKLMLEDTSFGGASIQYPLKEQIHKVAKTITEPVHFIGAANTIILTEDGLLHADNTDWIGILKPLRGATVDISRPAIVVGRGSIVHATVYALMKLGFPAKNVFVHNSSGLGVDSSSSVPSTPQRDSGKGTPLTPSSAKKESLIGPSLGWSGGMRYCPQHIRSLKDVKSVENFGLVVAASESSQQRVAVEAEILACWSSNSPFGAGSIFFDVAGGNQRSIKKSRGMLGLAESLGCSLISHTNYATASGWEQFRRWIGDRSESMALAAAATMEEVYTARDN